MRQNDFTDIIPDIVYFVNRKDTPAWRIQRSRIDFHDLTYIYGGCATYLIDDNEYKLRQGDFIYAPPGSMREAYTVSDEPIQSYAVNFNLYRLYGGAGETDAPGDIVLPFDRAFKAGLTGEFIDLYSELDRIWVERSFNFEMRARAVFMLILDKLITRVSATFTTIHEDPRLSNVKQYILQNYMRKIKISELAGIAGLNAVYLGAYFKQVYGCTIKQYINHIRLNNAENLLSTGGYSVSEAATRSGFDDLFYFSKVYRKYKGYAPSRLLKNRTNR